MLRTLQQTRKFSTSSSVSRQLFAVIAKDYTGEEAVQNRLSVRRQHIENANKSFVKGILKSGGALVDPHGSGNMLGSLMIIEAESIEKAREFVEKDIYIEKKVWETWEIYPYKAALGNK
ncbi:hypothetical protein BC941DRAFT_418141 [Chlamydoabsidia padenii]|nr:hypothetical protein BC941DRAFT_418141 [Chlamydoabsidia padenii]